MMNKTTKILTAVLLFAAAATAHAATQNYGTYTFPSPYRQPFQQAIEKVTFPFWKDLKLALQGEYANTQKQWREKQAQRAEDQRALTRHFEALYFHYSPRRYGAKYELDLQETQGLPQEEILALEIEKKARLERDKQLQLQRYDRLQEVISDNFILFPGYVLDGQSMLVDLNENTMKTLVQILSGTNANNTSPRQYKKANRSVLVWALREQQGSTGSYTDISVLINAENRSIRVVTHARENSPWHDMN